MIKSIDFFKNPPDDLSKELLGKIFCRKMDDGFVMRCRITEIEAYSGDEQFCYGYGGKKLKNKSKVFYSVGKLCVYKSMLMISCLDEIGPDNILIRGLDCYVGPKKCAEALDVRNEMNGIDLTVSDMIWLEDDRVKVDCKKDKRVNILDKKKRNFWIKTIVFE